MTTGHSTVSPLTPQGSARSLPAACDVGAVIYFLRKLSWVAPDSTVTKYRDQLLRLHEQIEAEGSFVTHISRVLIDVRKPG
jgi:hypothetical protein